jgi:hypothetical protein
LGAPAFVSMFYAYRMTWGAADTRALISLAIEHGFMEPSAMIRPAVAVFASCVYDR